mgnify:CR=1 FL=1
MVSAAAPQGPQVLVLFQQDPGKGNLLPDPVVQRLYDSQFGSHGVDDIASYIKLGKLGEAFSAEEQVVLLIDEIDKADLES